MSKIKNTFKNIFKNHKKYLLIGVLVLAALAYFIFGRGSNETEIYMVNRADVSESVVLSGKVMTTDRADLGFASSGRLNRIFVKNNQNVRQGQTLAQLEIGDLLADLKIKQANSKVSTVDLEGAKEEVEKITKQEDTKVASAYRTLLSEGLELVPNSSSYTVEPPTLGGIYDGREGQYKIAIHRKDVNSSDLEIFTFNLEKTNRIVNKEGSTPLGTRGLYVFFGRDELLAYEDTIWFLDIPNKSSSSYLTNFNEYNEAKNARALAIKNAEFDYQKLLTEEGGGDSIAQAEIQKINAEIRKNTIYAPFPGIVTNIGKEVGENASLGERVVSVLGEEKLEIVLQVSELDVSKLLPESVVQISIDAVPGENFSGILKTVNSRETEIEGVPVYEAFVELAPDSRIKTGMSATGTIVLSTKKAVLAIPLYLIKKSKEGSAEVNTVEVMNTDGKRETRTLTLGLVGTDSMVEIISGLNEGDKVLSEATKK